MGSSSGTVKKAQQGMHYSCDYYPRKNKIISVQHRQQHSKQRQKTNPSLYFTGYLMNIFPLATEPWPGKTRQQSEAWLPCSWPWRDEGGRDLSQGKSDVCVQHRPFTTATFCFLWSALVLLWKDPSQAEFVHFQLLTLKPILDCAHVGKGLSPCSICSRGRTAFSWYWYSVSPLSHFSAGATTCSSTTRR